MTAHLRHFSSRKDSLYIVLIFLCNSLIFGNRITPDGSAVYMKEVVPTKPYQYGLAYSGFALCMTVERLSRDALIPG